MSFNNSINQKFIALICNQIGIVYFLFLDKKKNPYISETYFGITNKLNIG